MKKKGKDWNKYLYAIFDEYNRKYFKGKLPSKETTVTFKIFDRDEFCYGACAKYNEQQGRNKWDSWHIGVNWELRHWDVVVRMTMLHEMAHLATRFESGSHGSLWKAEIKRLIRSGAFDDLL